MCVQYEITEIIIYLIISIIERGNILWPHHEDHNNNNNNPFDVGK